MVTVAEHSRLSSYVYQGASGSSPPPGWLLIQPSEPKASGFYGEALQNTETGEIVVAFRGTDNLANFRVIH